VLGNEKIRQVAVRADRNAAAKEREGQGFALLRPALQKGSTELKMTPPARRHTRFGGTISRARPSGGSRCKQALQKKKKQKKKNIPPAGYQEQLAVWGSGNGSRAAGWRGKRSSIRCSRSIHQARGHGSAARRPWALANPVTTEENDQPVMVQLAP